MPLTVVLFVPGYTLSSCTIIPEVLRGDFRDRDAENAPAGTGPEKGRGSPPGSRRYRRPEADEVPFGVEDHRDQSHARDLGDGPRDRPAQFLHPRDRGFDILDLHEIKDRLVQLPLVQPAGAERPGFDRAGGDVVVLHRRDSHGIGGRFCRFYLPAEES